jgi:ATP-dependent helicase/nuclease subunit B
MTSPLPRVSYIPAHRPFALDVARAILAQYGDNFAALSQIDIFVPNRRSCRTLAEAFLAVRDGKPCLLPNIQPIGDVQEDDIALSDIFTDTIDDIPPAIPSLERQILLGELIHKHRPDVPPAHIFRLAAQLAALIDHVHTESLDWTKLHDLVPAELATHWNITVDFLSVLFEHWPLILQERGLIDPADRRNRLLQHKAHSLRNRKDPRPVIAIGSTGSIPATRDLLRTIAYLPQGEVILTGLDTDITEDVWEDIPETHPQFYFKNLIEHIGIARGHVAPWSLLQDPTPTPSRTLFLAQCVQGTTAISAQTIDKHALDGFQVARADNHQDEAKMIALKIRETLEFPQKTILLVTPDRSLARRVESELGRWDIQVNDSAGCKLNDTAIGTWLHITSQILQSDSTALALLSLLHHPFCRLGYHADEYRHAAELFERYILRGPAWAGGLLDIMRITQERLTHDHVKNDLKDHPDHHANILTFAQRLHDIFTPLLTRAPQSLATWLEQHIILSESCARTDEISGTDLLWRDEEGLHTAQALRDLMACAPLHSPLMNAMLYHDFISTYIGQQTFRPRYPRHPRVHILGPIEARFQQADVMILAGLNEAIWPRQAPHDPFMSQPMRDAFGLSPFRRRIGQAALDFYILSHTPHCFVTYSHTQNGAILAPSRWLQQMEIVLQHHHLSGLVDTPLYRDLVKIMDKPTNITPTARPSYAPPLSARPRRISVSDLALWRQDPYGLYAKKILNLRPLDKPDMDIAPRDWGNLVHMLIEKTIIQTPFPLTLWHDLSHHALSTLALPERLRIQWQSRLRLIGQFLAGNPLAYDVMDTEITGTYKFHEQDFVVHGRADMIMRRHGKATIIDSKTGTIPSWTQVESGFAPQLPFLALSLLQQGFHEIPATTELDTICYWGIKGKVTEDPIKIVPYTKNLHDLLERNRSLVAYMIALFDNPDQAYITRPHAKYVSPYNDFDHLERTQEWSSQSSGGDE